jgi:hypothetical protein
MRSVAAVLELVVLVGCGGSSIEASGNPGGGGGGPPIISYGEPQAPGLTEIAAASTLLAGMRSALAVGSDSTDTSALMVVALPAATGQMLFEGSELGLAAPTPAIPVARSVAEASSCSTVTRSSVTFDNCISADSTGASTAINGTVSWTQGSVTFDVTEALSAGLLLPSQSIDRTGSFEISPAIFKGTATNQTIDSAPGGEQGSSYGIAETLNADLTLQQAPDLCITGGTLEVTRGWAPRPSAASGMASIDLGVKMTWTACNVFTVQRGQ